MITLRLTLSEALHMARSKGLTVSVEDAGASWRIIYGRPGHKDTAHTVTYTKAWTREEALRDSFANYGQHFVQFFITAELK